MEVEGRYSIDEFITETSEKDRGEGLFELENERILEVNLDGYIWTRIGSMIAYLGDIKFTRETLKDQGIGKFLKKAVTGEGTTLSKAQGKGKLYLAHQGKKISVINLQQGESLIVNGNDILAFANSVKWDITLMKSIGAMLGGGLFNIKLEGPGLAAITTYYKPLTLKVTPDKPVMTDPSATVAWSGNLTPDFKTDMSWHTLIGRGGGETFQMKFQGEGFVVVQPFEEVYTTSA